MAKPTTTAKELRNAGLEPRYPSEPTHVDVPEGFLDERFPEGSEVVKQFTTGGYPMECVLDLSKTTIGTILEYALRHSSITFSTKLGNNTGDEWEGTAEKEFPNHEFKGTFDEFVGYKVLSPEQRRKKKEAEQQVIAEWRDKQEAVIAADLATAQEAIDMSQDELDELYEQTK